MKDHLKILTQLLGVVLKPIEGATKDGVGGFFKGVGKVGIDKGTLDGCEIKCFRGLLA